MQVIRAETAGFCMGVSLALKKLENAIRQNSGPIRTFGPIIHNPQVLADFARQGVKCITQAEAAQAEDLVLIRAHGITRNLETLLRKRCARVEDATCPKVKKAQLAIANATKGGKALALFGESEHPEVAGLVSYACGPAQVFSSRAELDTGSLKAERGVVLASQTTQDRVTFEKIAAELAALYPEITILNTICDATAERQKEALAIAGRVDAMVVVGGRQSGNTRRLASLALGSGIETYLVETCAELSAESFAGKNLVGLTAGASTPKNLIDAAYEWLLAL
ncbi:MAG: 4-hydroxy-3-methylbut-2-enyl diphosphate reductase [Desulfovibrio sp.]|nr:4-hydroxy-3-methylbut-2-enyl diphosphate reductase [Desulfovibrio sp.]